jgi:endonuclease/exonuclease/phosphatase family metal-dependent hydrolase
MKAANARLVKFLGIFAVVFIVLLWAGAPAELGGLYDQVQPAIAPGTAENEITIGAFNIQVFGTSKAAKEDVMDVLAGVVREYDLIAIQEIRDASQTALPALVNRTNQDGSFYAAVVSERLGRTSSKEQYAFVYNTQTMMPDGAAHTYPEPAGTDPFHREPFIARFSTTDGGFDAVYIVVHTDPDEAEDEIAALGDVVSYVREIYPGEDDIVVMGDLNADGSYFNESSDTPLHTPGYYWLIPDEADTTVGTTPWTYDRIIITESMAGRFSGNAGVLRFDEHYNLTGGESLAVSDHYPVYASFFTGAAGGGDGFWPDLNATWHENNLLTQLETNSTADNDTGSDESGEAFWSFLNTTWYKYNPLPQFLDTHASSND